MSGSAASPPPGGSDLNGSEVLWRRFDDRDPAHFDSLSVDEESGASRLKGGALRFDNDGCSVFRERVIVQLGLRPGAIATRQYSALAAATCGEIDGFHSGLATDGEPEFRVAADPLETPPPYNPAHTLIEHHGAYASKTKRRQAIHQLARRVFRIP